MYRVDLDNKDLICSSLSMAPKSLQCSAKTPSVIPIIGSHVAVPVLALDVTDTCFFIQHVVNLRNSLPQDAAGKLGKGDRTMEENAIKGDILLMIEVLFFASLVHCCSFWEGRQE